MSALFILPITFRSKYTKTMFVVLLANIGNLGNSQVKLHRMAIKIRYIFTS